MLVVEGWVDRGCWWWRAGWIVGVGGGGLGG